jgi:predicted acyltransferase
MIDQSPQPLVVPAAGAARTRLLSLDVFRGITVAAMILVNNPGSWGHVYAPLRHAEWNGCTPTDLVFPFFLFIVGVAITYALGSLRNRPGAHAAAIGRIARRSLILFGLGLFLALFPSFDFATVRIPGVLQRIAVVFLVCGVVFLKTGWRTQAGLMLGLLVLYYVLMCFVPVPGVGFSNLQPTTNLAAWVDNKLLAGHLWRTTRVWDPEGLLSTLPAIATGLSGVLTGHWIRREAAPAEKAAWMFVLGNAALVAGLAWNYAFPINKSLWTSSYVLYTAGLALNGLALCYWLVDVKGYRRWTAPFVAFGVNAITAFFLAGLLPRVLNMIRVTGADGRETGLQGYLYQTLYTPLLSPYNASLAWALSYVLLFLALVWFMYRHNIIIKV